MPLKSSPSRSDASQTFKEHGPAVCQVITTSLPYSLARYNHRLSEISPRASSTFPNFVRDVSSNSRRLPALSLSLTGENYTVSLSSAERDTQTIFSKQSYFRPWKAIFRYLASPSGEICNAVQKYYVNRPLPLILTERKIKH